MGTGNIGHRSTDGAPWGRGAGEPRQAKALPALAMPGMDAAGSSPEGGLTHTGPGGATAAAAGGPGSHWPPPALPSPAGSHALPVPPPGSHRLAPIISFCPGLIDPSHSISIDLSPRFSFFLSSIEPLAHLPPLHGQTSLTCANVQTPQQIISTPRQQKE